jgi:carboxylate-amine ligase
MTLTSDFGSTRSERDRYTLGVEEEYLTVDARSLELRPRADRILHAARPDLGTAVQSEMNLALVEVATAVCRDLAEVEGALGQLRRSVSEAALSTGASIAATGTHPTAEWLGQAITPVERFLGLEDEYQQLAREQLICGCHVHVGIDDPDDVIRIMDSVRPWVPVLLALGANSPYWQGFDTGYASYRTQVFDRWPTAGPAPRCGDRQGYDDIVASLVGLNVIPDESYIYWHVRPSGRYPTLELRVADVALTIEDATALAGLFRALVRTCHRTPATHDDLSHELVRGATWRACRYGLDGTLIDLVARDEVPAPEAVQRLLGFVRPHCDDRAEWDELSERTLAILARGNGAQRQRATLRATGRMSEVTRMIVQATVPAREGAVVTPRAAAPGSERETAP